MQEAEWYGVDKGLGRAIQPYSRALRERNGTDAILALEIDIPRALDLSSDKCNKTLCPGDFTVCSENVKKGP